MKKQKLGTDSLKIVLKMKVDTAILNLPDELIVRILNELDLVDLVSFRLLNKRFRFLIDNLQIKKKLIISNFDDYFDTIGYHDGFYALEPEINYVKESFNPVDKNLRFLNFPLFKRIFRNLQELQINLNVNHDFFDAINEFVKLEKLFIKSIYIGSEKIIKLPNLVDLSILTIRDLDGGYPKVKVIVKSKIEKLKYNSHHNAIKLKHVKRLKFLEVHSPNNEIRKFKKLKTLKCHQFNILTDNVSINTFRELKELKEFYIDDDFIDERERTTEFINELLRLKNSKEINLEKIYFYEIEITKPFEAYAFYDNDELRRETIMLAQMFFYNLLCKKPTILRYINYNEFTGFLLNHGEETYNDMKRDEQISKLPFDFFEKLRFIQHVTVANLKEDHDFMIFLSRCSYLKVLEVCDSKLTQHSLNQLTSICGHSLHDLNLRLINDEELDFSFLLQFKYLFELRVQPLKDYILVAKIVESCKYLRSFYFRHGKLNSSIFKKPDQLFEICACNSTSEILSRSDLKLKKLKRAIRLVAKYPTTKIKTERPYYAIGGKSYSWLVTRKI